MNQMLKKKKMSLSRKFFIFCFIIVPTINFLVFYVYVNFDGILMAFYTSKLGGEKEWGLQNFRAFFQELKHMDSGLGLAFVNTFKTFLINMIIFPWGIVVSYFLYKKIPFYKGFRLLFFLPSIINGIITVVFYRNLVSPDPAGPLALLTQKINGLSEPPDLLGDPRYANIFVWVHLLWLSFPGDMIIWGGAFARIPDSVIESARLDGAKWTTELTRIILPMIWPTFALKMIIFISAVFGSSGAVFLLTGGKESTKTITFSVWQYINILNTKDPTSNVYNYISAVGIVVTLASMLLVVLGKVIENKCFKDVDY